MKKNWLRILVIAAVVLVVILVALPFIVVHMYDVRSKVQSEASAALGRPVTIGDLSLSILSGSLEAKNIAIADDPAFSKSPFVTAQSLKIGVELLPLIFSQKMNVTEIVLAQPQITLLSGPKGTWNYSNLGAASTNKPAEPKTGGTAGESVSVGKLNITNGKLMVGRANSSAKPKVYDNVNVTVTDFSTTSQFPFKLTADLPGGGNADISGKAGPINAADSSKTPFEAAVKVNNMDIAASGFVDPSTGIGGLANFDGTLNSDGSHAKAIGTFTGAKMKFAPKATPAPKTIVIKHSVDVDLDSQLLTLTQGDLSIGKAQAHLTGTIQSQGETQIANLKLNAPGMPVEELEAMAPAFGIVLPTGSQLKGGTLSANLAITGPVDKLVIAGPVKLSDTSLVGFNLGAQMGALSAFAGKAVSSPDTSIKSLSANAHVSPAGTQADNINLDVPAIGVITGGGTVSPAGALAFKMLANLHGGMVGGVSKVASAGSGKNGIPFAIEGTTANPKFVPELGGMVTGLATTAVKGAVTGAVGAPGAAAAAPTKAVGGLLGKKH